MNEFNPSVANFYRHSGKAPLLGLLIIGATGFIAIPILGLIYGYLIFYIPFIIINFFIVIGYLAIISVVLNKAAVSGKIRNSFVIGITGFGFGLLAEYVGWVAWIAALVKDPSFLFEFLFPQDVIKMIIAIGEVGVWSFRGATPSGAFLYFIWLLEAIMVVGGITYLTLKAFSDIPFCEDSEVWANKKSTLAVFAPLTNPDQFKASILQGGISAFNEIKPIQSGSAFTMLELYECEVCKNFFVLNVKDVKISFDRKGRQNRTEKMIVKHLILTPSTLSTLKRTIEEKAPQA